MFSYGKTLTVAISAAALSGTLLVPSSKSFAYTTPQTAVSEAPVSQAAPIANPAPAAEAPPIALPAPAPVAAPKSRAVAADEDDGVTLSSSEMDCLAKVILYEAGSESRAGQLAVAQVVLNRMRSGRFARTACGVIYQPGQFSSIRSFSPPRNARWQRAMGVAREAVGGAPQVAPRALYFHASRVRPAYVRSRPRVAQIGNHIFYR